MHVSGTKKELATRIMAWKPYPPMRSQNAKSNPPTASQLKYLQDLEITSGIKARALAYVYKKACSKEIDELKKQV